MSNRPVATGLGGLPIRKGHRWDWERKTLRPDREVDELLDSLDVSISSHTPVQGLSVAEKQLVEIAKALSLQARVLVLDEPTAALSGHEVDELFAIVRRLRERGVAILFVSHRLEEVFAIADRVTIFRDGTFIVTKPINEINTEDVIKYMVGRELSNLFPKGDATIGDVVLDVKNLTRAGVFRDINFQLHRGQRFA